MSAIETLLATLLGRWATSFAGLAIAGTLVWYLGPLVPGLGSRLSRVALILLLVMLWAGVNAALSFRRRRRDRALAAGVTEEDPSHAARPSSSRAAGDEEVRRLRQRLRESLSTLRRARGGGRFYLYEQPWFVVIGPPGAGKTTALTQCGLRYPLAKPDGAAAAVAGVGGTRLCDWWFADEAVLIDTAGRYTTQDSNQQVDQAGWLGFLDLLRRTRPRQPLNGVLVVMSLAEIGTVASAERVKHALAVRSRIKELTDRLGVRLPVYAVFSKADRIAGFTEFFDDLDQGAREQVWGTTFALSQGVEMFGHEYRLLIDRLDQRLFERLQAERGPDRRVAIAAFPLQMASLEAPLAEFLGTAFGGTRLDPAPLLRGVYFTSGTQEGTPVDRLTGMLARTFGIDQRRAPSLRPVAGRSYFIGRTVREVILGEALLVSSSPRVRRRRLFWRAAGFSTVGIVTAAACLLLWREHANNAGTIAQAQAAIDAYRGSLAALPLDPVRDDDLARILPVLDAARALPGGGTAQDGLADRLGIGQGDKLAVTDRLAYRHALERVLLPRLVWRLEGQMRSHLDRPDFLYEATRVYLMLGNDGPLDLNLVRDWMALDWNARYPGPVFEPMRTDLLRHLDALLAGPLPTVPLDGALVREARSTFSRVSPAERVYSRIRPGAAASAVPPWSPDLPLGGGGGDQLFTRISGRPLSDGIPGFYTAEGFRSVLLPALRSAARDVSDEAWVLGRQPDQDGPDGLQALEAGVIALYAADYIRLWDAMLDDLALEPFRNHADAVQKLYVMASPQSPLRDLLVSIVHELSPARAAAEAAPHAAGNAGASAEHAATDGRNGRLSAMFAQGGPDGPTPAPPGSQIDEHYRALTDFTGPTGQAAPITGIFRLLNQLQGELAQLSGAENPSAVLAGSQDPAQLLSAEADRQPQPVARWLHQISSGGGTMLRGDAHEAAAGAFNNGDGPAHLCHQVVDKHYPFDPDAAADAPLDDFARLFAPGGALDAYFKTQLRPYVDTSGPAWHGQPVGGIAPPASDASLAMFQQAARIRDQFFPTGGGTPSLHFTVTPVSADPKSRQVMLTLGAVTVTWQPGSVHGSGVTWPSDGPNESALVFKPAASFPRHADGAWSLFRLLDGGTVEPADAPGRYLLGFRSGDREAEFSVEMASANTPLDTRALQAFRCPVLK